MYGMKGPSTAAFNGVPGRERCLVFVALTRARDHLYIPNAGPPSTFLR
jgi:hypothetical protein